MFSQVLITGASSGIGLAIAKVLSNSGYQCLMLSYDEHELGLACSQVAHSQPVVCDLSYPQQREGLWKKLQAQWGPIEVLINNAGLGHHASIVNTELETFRHLMEVNYFAPVDLCRQAMEAMAARGGGQILNLTSASARRSLARMGAYGASKAALHGFTQSLRAEARPLGIRVSEVLPISVDTPFFRRAGFRPRGLVQTPEQVAALVLKCLQRGTPERVSHPLASWALALEALVPNWLARWW